MIRWPLKKHLFAIAFLALAASMLSGCSLLDPIAGSNVSGKAATVSVDNSHFTYRGIGFGNVITNGKRPIGASFVCDLDLVMVGCNASLYAGNTLYENKSVEVEQTVKAGVEDWVHLDSLPTSVFSTITSIQAVFHGYSPASSTGASAKAVYHTVSFYWDANDLYTTKSVRDGATLDLPNPPSKKYASFSNWSTTSSYLTAYSTTAKVTADFSLYAFFNIDYSSLRSAINDITLKSVIKIETHYWNSFLWIPTDGLTSQGSGVIFEAQNGNYYALTNNHVTVENSKYKNYEIKVYDYLNSEYTAHLLHAEASYDLSCIYFSQGSNTLQKVTRREKNVSYGNFVCAIGYPSGNRTITYGQAEDYQNSYIQAFTTQVAFPVLVHTAKINPGSSGGPLFDDNLYLCGINFASGTTSSGSWAFSLSIPISEVNIFLSTYVYK
jgi:S1-C subfamily serine protease